MTKRVFDKVNEGLLVTVNGIEAIASTTKVLDDARGQVMSSVESLSAIAEENAAATEETAASAEELAATIGEIKSGLLPPRWKHLMQEGWFHWQWMQLTL